jgi:hypothetical protein
MKRKMIDAKSKIHIQITNDIESNHETSYCYVCGLRGYASAPTLRRLLANHRNVLYTLSIRWFSSGMMKTIFHSREWQIGIDD